MPKLLIPTQKRPFRIAALLFPLYTYLVYEIFIKHGKLSMQALKNRPQGGPEITFITSTINE